MSWVEDLINKTIGQLKFWEVIREDKGGVRFLNGKALNHRKELDNKSLEKILAEEEEMRKKTGKTGMKKYLPWIRPEYHNEEEAWHHSILGLPRHPDRYSKDLEPGTYLYVPIIGEVQSLPVADVVLDLPNLSVLTKEEDPEKRVIGVSCNVHYHVESVYKAFIKLHDYEKSYVAYAMGTLARLSRGKDYAWWKNPEDIEKLEKELKDELNKTPRREWGIRTERVLITDSVPHKVVRHFHEGIPKEFTLSGTLAPE